MNRDAFLSIVSKVSTVAPFFGKALIDVALKKIGKTPETVTPAEIVRIVSEEINPRLAKELKTTNSVLLAGAAQIITDADDRIVFKNTAAAKFLKTLLEQEKASESETFACLERRGYIVSAKTIQSVEIWERFDAHTGKYYSAALCPIVSEVGKTTGVNCLIQDVSLKSAIEKDLVQYSERLKTEIEEREKVQAMLVHSSKFTALGEMAGGIAHEINNPLAVVKMLSEQLADEFQDSENKSVCEKLKKLAHHSERIAAIVRGLRKFSRSGETTPMASVDLRQIVRDTLDFCEQKFKHGGVELRLDLPETPVPALCRDVEISQVLLNLLNNAYDAIQSLDRKWIEVAIVTSSNQLEIRVTDCGGGIPLRIRESLFQPFFTTKAIGAGTGLGLSISKGIMQEHGGDLALDLSCPNTRFVARLPKGC